MQIIRGIHAEEDSVEDLYCHQSSACSFWHSYLQTWPLGTEKGCQNNRMAAGVYQGPDMCSYGSQHSQAMALGGVPSPVHAAERL